ncbi:hypothetical protein LMG27174_00811 [Paraburkholderia rhynchosiae]|uniref:Uncharacterized protein n=1 Tax=Paraburkholderia rhynchosiae TaxID=487049 RepID=A0A6J5A4P5_9BURK|nr:hypothetical protein LMG27174_00811 [Paraburkholderia rhynchosiae]
MTLRVAGGAALIVQALFVPTITIYSDEGHGWTGYWLARQCFWVSSKA